MAELKTKPNDQSVTDFLNTIPDLPKRQDCFTLVNLMQEVTKAEPRMWGSSIVGFGSYHYANANGHGGKMCLVGFSPRKQNLSLYIMAGSELDAELLKKLGKHKTGKSCLYINRLDDVHLPTLKKLVQQAVKHMARTNR